MSLAEVAPHLRAWPVSDGYAKYMSDHEASTYGFLEEYRADLEFASPAIHTPKLLRRSVFTGIGVTSCAGEFPTPTLERSFDGTYLQASSRIDALLSALQHIRGVLPVEKAPVSDDYEVVPGSRQSSGAIYLQQACGQIGSSPQRRALLGKAQEVVLDTHKDIINMPQYFTSRDPSPTSSTPDR